MIASQAIVHRATLVTGPLLLVVLGKPEGLLHISPLRGLVTTGQQQQQSRSLEHVVNPIPRPDVDLEFADATGQMTVRPGVPVHEPVNAHLDPGENADVSHTVDPVAVCLGLLDTQ